MGYTTALEAAGAEILEYKETGSYQGSWGAIVNYRGEKCLVTGAYGSCSGCDSFQAQFDYDSEPEQANGKYYRNGNTWDEYIECSEQEFAEAKEAYRQKLSDFAQSYLETPMYKADIEQKLSALKADDWFDSEEMELYEWAITFFN